MSFPAIISSFELGYYNILECYISKSITCYIIISGLHKNVFCNSSALYSKSVIANLRRLVCQSDTAGVKQPKAQYHPLKTFLSFLIFLYFRNQIPSNSRLSFNSKCSSRNFLTAMELSSKLPSLGQSPNITHK
jgi:hypothetical protein